MCFWPHLRPRLWHRWRTYLHTCRVCGPEQCPPCWVGSSVRWRAEPRWRHSGVEWCPGQFLCDKEGGETFATHFERKMSGCSVCFLHFWWVSKITFLSCAPQPQHPPHTTHWVSHSDPSMNDRHVQTRCTEWGLCTVPAGSAKPDPECQREKKSGRWGARWGARRWARHYSPNCSTKPESPGLYLPWPASTTHTGKNHREGTIKTLMWH